MLSFFKKKDSDSEKGSNNGLKPLGERSKADLLKGLSFTLENYIEKYAQLGKLSEKEIREVVEKALYSKMQRKYEENFPHLLNPQEPPKAVPDVSAGVKSSVSAVLNKNSTHYQEYQRLREPEKSPDIKIAQQDWFYSLKKFAFREQDIPDEGGDLEDFYGTNIAVFETGDKVVDMKNSTSTMKARMANHGLNMCPLSEVDFKKALEAHSLVKDMSYSHIVSTGDMQKTVIFEDPDTYGYYTKKVVFDANNRRVYVVGEDEDGDESRYN